MSYETKYLREDNSVCEVIQISKTQFVPANEVFTPELSRIYDKKEDALFENVISRLKSGIPFTNYKRSKYYKYYHKRLTEEYPEYII